MGLKYIYTGFNKCGTKTIKEAFEILGFKVYDFEENAIFLSKHWIKFFSPKTSTDEKYQLLYEMFKDVDALVEGPNLYFWKEILTVFPECKVVHFQREEDAWYKSVVKQVKGYSHDSYGNNLIPNWLVEGTLWFVPTLARTSYVQRNHLSPLMCGEYGQNYMSPWSLSSPKLLNELAIKRAYRQHNTDVINNCPKNRILILPDINCGWELLCQFTKKSIPEQEWPHMNKNGHGLFEESKYTASCLYNPFEQPKSPFMRQLKREATERAVLLVVLIVLGSFVWFYCF